MRVVRESVLLVLLILLAGSCSFAQNRVLVVTDSASGILVPDSLTSQVLDRTPFFYEYLSYVPAPLDPTEFSSIILASQSAAIACQPASIDEYIRKGGGLVCGGGVPIFLANTPELDPVVDWFGCQRYANSSGQMIVDSIGEAFGLTPGTVLDNMPCYYGFGGLQGASGDVSVIAHWSCDDIDPVVSILKRQVGAGSVVYMSRMTATEPLRDLFPRAMLESMEYVWGDANNSRFVDLDDIIFLIDYIFGEGIPPEVWNAADPSGDGIVDIDDVVDLIEWIFTGTGNLKAGRIE